MLKDHKNFFIGVLVISLIFTFSLTIYAFPEDAHLKDVPNSSDHPLISRFKGSYIRYYDHINYDEFRNYEIALEEAGFETIRMQKKDFGHGISSQIYSKVNWNSCPGNNFNGVGVHYDSGDQSYLAAKLERSEGDVYISLYVADHGIHGGNWGEERPAVYQVVVEEKEMKTGLVTAKSDYKKDEKDEEKVSFPEDVQLKDVPNSSDHPLISRFKGSYIRYYDHINYDEFTFPFSRLKDTEEDKKVEGEITKNFYVIPDGHSVLEVFRNYEIALEEAGFETIRMQKKDFGHGISSQIYSKVNWNSCPGNNFNGVGVHYDSGDQSYLAAKLERSEGDVYISLYVADHGIHGGNWGEERPAVYQVVVEEKEMKTGLVTAKSDYKKDEKDEEKVSFPEDVQLKDVPNSSDHPLISRFKGSYIRYYDHINYDEFTFPFSRLKDTEEDKKVEGEITRNFYVIPNGHSVLEVFRNYETALENAGFEIIRKQTSDISHKLSNCLYSEINWDSCPRNNFNGVGVHYDTGDQSYLTAKLERSEGDVYISLYVADHGIHGGNWGEERPAVYQVVVEEKEMKTGLVTAKSDYKKDEKDEEKVSFPEDVQLKDVPNSSDHPLISRFKGSYIRYYDHINYDEFTFPFSRLKDTEEDKKVEGEITKNFYVIPDGHSVLEVFRNYEIALEEAGFETIRMQ